MLPGLARQTQIWEQESPRKLKLYIHFISKMQRLFLEISPSVDYRVLSSVYGQCGNRLASPVPTRLPKSEWVPREPLNIFKQV